MRPASFVTIRDFVMGLPESQYQTARVLPMLTTQTKLLRLQWAKAFHVFWHGARLIAKSVQILLCMNDKKCFFALKVRKFQKSVLFFGVTRQFHSVHHKSHIEKVLCLATTGFLPFNNNINEGGRSVKIHLQRAGGLVPAKKDSYKRVYKQDGTYHYPQVPQNRLRVAGELYFENWEITGSDKGSKKSPKFSLLKYWSDKLLPALDAQAQQLERDTNKKIIVRFQWDNAGPHTNQRLKNFLTLEFDRRGWLFTPQPPNSPLTNT